MVLDFIVGINISPSVEILRGLFVTTKFTPLEVTKTMFSVILYDQAYRVYLIL